MLEIVVSQSELLFNQDKQVKNALKGWNDIKMSVTELDKILKRFMRISRDFCVVIWWKVYSQDASFLDKFQLP